MPICVPTLMTSQQSWHYFIVLSLQIFISLVCAMLTTPVIMLLILLFKRTKRKQPNAGRSCCSTCCSTCCCCSCGTFVRSLFRTRRREEERRYEEMLQSKMLTSVIPEFSGGFYFPSWWVVRKGQASKTLYSIIIQSFIDLVYIKVVNEVCLFVEIIGLCGKYLKTNYTL